VTSPTPPSDAASAGDGLDALLEAARTLWPPPLEVSYHRGRSGPDLVSEQIVLPGPSSPRICVPGDTRKGAAATVMRFSSALPPRRIATRMASALAVGVGPRAAFPHRLVVTGSTADGLREHLSAALGRPVSFGFGIGTARANRKPVLALFGKDGARLGFAKIGVDRFTDAQVTRERDSLQELAQGRIDGVRTPELLDFGTWEQHPVLVIGALKPSAWQTARRGTHTPLTQMEALGRALGVQESPLSESAWWTTIVQSVRDLPQDSARDDLLAAVEVITTRWAGLDLRLGAWHGDWTPWNMGWSRGKLLLWDFERFEPGAPLGLDACHYASSVPTSTDDPDEIVRRLQAAPTGGDPTRAELVKAVYLVAITSRYQVAAHSENGWLIAPRAAVMARCLASWLDKTAAGRVHR
jgi:hypothetical protein